MSPYSTFRTYLNTHDFATRPNAIFSTLQGTQNPDTKPTLQRAKNANAQPTHPSGRISIIFCSIHQQQIFTEHQSPPTTQMQH